jgi:hypothetical protein
MPRSHLCAATTLSAVLLFSPVLPPCAALAQMAHGHDGPWTTRAIAGYLDGKGCIVSKYSRLWAPPLICSSLFPNDAQGDAGRDEQDVGS